MLICITSLILLELFFSINIWCYRFYHELNFWFLYLVFVTGLEWYPCQPTSQTSYNGFSQLNLYLGVAVPKILKKIKNNSDGIHFCKVAGDFIKKEVYMKTITIFKSTWISFFRHFWSCFSEVYFNWISFSYDASEASCSWKSFNP